MKIKKYSNSGSYAYLWLKEVKGVDLTHHCANCLVGEYDNRIKQSIKNASDLELNNSIYYLCGVARPFNWNDNFHLAFEPCDGETLIYSDRGIQIEIENAISLPISDSFIDPYHPKAKFKTYRTCRNWQFSHYLNSSDKLS